MTRLYVPSDGAVFFRGHAKHPLDGVDRLRDQVVWRLMAMVPLPEQFMGFVLK